MNAQNFFKMARNELGFTLAGLAQATGHSLSDIKNYQYGRARVTGDMVLQLQAMLEAKKRQKP
jgi:plasmid maintenance system antidote protein VapI